MAGYKLISFDKIPSTQTYALDLIAQNQASDCSVITAKIQTAGRGRYSRKWISNSGNLYASFIYSAQKKNPCISYSVAVAIAETIISFGIAPLIKWPNDILIDEKKVCGVLIEYSSDFMVVGIGVNIKSCPKIANYKTTKLDNYAHIDSDEFLSRLIKNLDKWRTTDFNKVRIRWTELALGLNRTIQYQNQPAELIGLDETGALILRRNGDNFRVYGDEIII